MINDTQTMPDVNELLPVPGNIFENKYRIGQPLGAGGFARVYRARFEDVGRDVAIKVLAPQIPPPHLYSEELVQRFHREARAVSELRSPHTITLHDFGRARSGLLYIVFEFVDGVPLDTIIKRLGPLAADRTMNVLRQILLSLHEAHSVGILHRDIKPANIMLYDYLGQVDQVKVLDFGIAKNWTHSSDGHPHLGDLTEAGTVVGTPRYMSPEQIIGQQLTPASDLYSVGLIGFEMLTGHPAAPGDDKSMVVRRHLGPEPIALPPQAPVPADFAAIIHRLTAKDHRQRFQSAAEVLQALEGNASMPTQQQGFASRAQYPSGAQQSLSFGGAATPQDLTAPSTPGNGFAATPATVGGQLARPERTFIQVRNEPGLLEISVPPKPTKKALLIAGATGVFFMVSVIATSLSLLFLAVTAPAFAWGISLVFRQYHLLVRPDSGYELGMNVLGVFERHKRGPAQSLVRFEARGTEAEDDTVLKLITHEGEFTVADGFTEAENAWVAAEGNAWIARHRA